MADQVLAGIEKATPSRDVQYTITSRSQLLLGKAKRQLQATQDVDFRRLDICQNIFAQVHQYRNCEATI